MMNFPLFPVGGNANLDPLAVLAGGSAGSWSILRILLGIDDLLVVFGLFHLRSSSITPLHPATSTSSDKLGLELVDLSARLCRFFTV